MNTVIYLQRAALAGALAIPIAAVGAVLAQGDGDEPTPGGSERQPCDGCGALCPLGDLTEGPLQTQWCACCNAASDAAPPAWDCVEEEDGEP